MKSSTRNILIGVGTTAALGAIYYFAMDEETTQKAESYFNRKKAKHFVKSKLDGNKKAMEAVDNLSDEEVLNLLMVVDKVTDMKGQLNQYGEQLKETTNEFRDMLMNKTSMVKNKVSK